MQLDRVQLFHRAAPKGNDFPRPLFGAHCHILLDLDTVEDIVPTLRLDRHNVVGTEFIDADVDFVSFNLTDTPDGRSEVVL